MIPTVPFPPFTTSPTTQENNLSNIISIDVPEMNLLTRSSTARSLIAPLQTSCSPHRVPIPFDHHWTPDRPALVAQTLRYGPTTTRLLLWNYDFTQLRLSCPAKFAISTEVRLGQGFQWTHFIHPRPKVTLSLFIIYWAILLLLSATKDELHEEPKFQRIHPQHNPSTDWLTHTRHETRENYANLQIGREHSQKIDKPQHNRRRPRWRFFLSVSIRCRAPLENCARAQRAFPFLFCFGKF